MSETAAHLALVETASEEGVARRRRHLLEHGPHELGWSYDNVREAERRLRRQLRGRGFFRLYLYLPTEEGGEVRYRMKVTALRTFAGPRPFTDPVDGRRYLVHCLMTVSAVEDLARPIPLEALRSADDRRPDPRHLQLGFLFVADPEA